MPGLAPVATLSDLVAALAQAGTRELAFPDEMLFAFVLTRAMSLFCEPKLARHRDQEEEAGPAQQGSERQVHQQATENSKAQQCQYRCNSFAGQRHFAPGLPLSAGRITKM
ncbi:MAG TPA: hypothetical protein VK192_06480 [Sphingomicrobium sp.]|nr:hypothetical protein [Sphingomicrobium sp.]